MPLLPRYAYLITFLVPSIAFAGSFDAASDTFPETIRSETRSSWAGPYAGVQLGFADFDFESGASIPVWAGSGPAIGFHLGYNHEFGRIVVGLEGEVDFSNIGLDFAPGSGTVGSTGQSVKRAVRLKARIGYDAGDLLPYVTAGYSNLNISESASDYGGDGPVFGLGVSYRLTDRIVVGGEALMHNIEDDLGSTTDYRVFHLRASYDF